MNEFEPAKDEFESDSFEFEANGEFEVSARPLEEAEEIELATELLGVSSDEEQQSGRWLRPGNRMVLLGT